MNGDELLVEVERVLAAAPARVFGAFSDPERLQRWLRPSPEIAMRVESMDFREGGLYRFLYVLPTGSEVRIGGVYRTIVSPTCLVFSWIIEPPDEHAGIDSEVQVTILPFGSGSKLTIRHLGWPSTAASRRHEGGWIGALERLASLSEVP